MYRVLAKTEIDGLNYYKYFNFDCKSKKKATKLFGKLKTDFEIVKVIKKD